MKAAFLTNAFDGFVELGTNSFQNGNATYFPDAIHWSDTLQIENAALVNAEIKRVLGYTAAPSKPNVNVGTFRFRAP
jgi:hypothetical protein